jgi:hypothetical protein
MLIEVEELACKILLQVIEDLILTTKNNLKTQIYKINMATHLIIWLIKVKLR